MTACYLTHDEVSAATARAPAARAGAGLTVLDVRDAPEIAAGRLVCDLDHLPADVAATLLARAAAGVQLDGVAVHSYRLRAGEVRRLRAAGCSSPAPSAAGCSPRPPPRPPGDRPVPV